MRATTNPFRLSHTLAATVGVGVLAGASIAAALTHREFPAPFFWLDVAVVYYLAALPLAATIVSLVWPISTVRARYFGLITVELAALLLVPHLYIHARTRSELARTIDLIQQSRFGEASRLVHRTIHLAPHVTLNDQPLSKIATTIDENVARLEAAVAGPLPPKSSDQDRLHRAQFFAMLGRTDEALAVLNFSPTLMTDADACNLRGAIFETRHQWHAARDWYAKGKSAWQTTDGSPEKSIGLARATTGVAYCERKLGRIREAEAAWLELLALAPTANSHFLLAQFYEDTQHTAKAKIHAEEAVKLDPDHYREPANKLLNNLITSHFGCLGVFRPSEALSR